MGELRVIPVGDCLVVCQRWDYWESGFIPYQDGFSLHLVASDAAQFVEEHWASDLGRFEHPVPDGDVFTVRVSQVMVDELRRNGGSRRFGRTYQVPSGLQS